MHWPTWVQEAYAEVQRELNNRFIAETPDYARHEIPSGLVVCRCCDCGTRFQESGSLVKIQTFQGVTITVTPRRVVESRFRNKNGMPVYSTLCTVVPLASGSSVDSATGKTVEYTAGMMYDSWVTAKVIQKQLGNIGEPFTGKLVRRNLAWKLEPEWTLEPERDNVDVQGR